MHPKPAGSQQEFPFQFWRCLVRSHRLVLVPTAVRALWHCPKNTVGLGPQSGEWRSGTWWKAQVCRRYLAEREKKAAEFQKEWVSDPKPVMLHHSWWKKNKFILVWAKKKAVSKLFRVNCFSMKQLLWNYTSKRNSFWKCQIKLFFFLKAWQQFVILTRSSHWDEYALGHALLFCFSNG